MAFVSTTKKTPVTLGDRIGAWLAGFGRATQDYRLYRQTLNELGAMSDRDLADIGISRVQVEDIAREAVYGKSA
jgi:uncharacterized protein YjiS (DUF1127 family)